MIAALLFGQASADGVQFFQPPVGGFLSQGSMVPMAGNQMAFQPVPYVANEMAFQPVAVSDVSEEGASDQSVVYAASFAVCALAVAGVAMGKQSMRANRRARVAAPVMLMGDFGQDIIQGPAEQVMQTRRKAYVVVFN